MIIAELAEKAGQSSPPPILSPANPALSRRQDYRKESSQSSTDPSRPSNSSAKNPESKRFLSSVLIELESTSTTLPERSESVFKLISERRVSGTSLSAFTKADVDVSMKIIVFSCRMRTRTLRLILSSVLLSEVRLSSLSLVESSGN